MPKIRRGKRQALVLMALILAAVVMLLAGCEEHTYTRTIKIAVEPANGGGLLVRIEYCHDDKVVNSLRFVDGDSDRIIDGKSGPTEKGHWPKGWEWFDALYNDVVIGVSTIEVVGEKIKIQNSTTYEFLPGEYEVGY